MNAEDNAVNEDQLDAENLFDDMGVEDNDGSTQTEEDYVDPYAVEIDDFSEDIDVDEGGIGKCGESHVSCLFIIFSSIS